MKTIVGIDARGLNNTKTGIATYIEETIKQINKKKDENIKYILYSNREININDNLNENIILKTYKKPAGTFWLYFYLPKILKRDNVDIFWGTQHLLPKRNKNTKKIKYVLTVHDLAIHKLKNIGEWKNTIIQKLFLEKSCKNADKIIADSKATKNDIVDIFNINKEKIEVVYLGTNYDNKYKVTEDKEKKILEKFNIENKNYLFFISTIEPRKNIVTLIKAFEKVKRENKDNSLKLILAGGLGWKYESVINSIENSEFKLDINLAGYITEEEKECLFKNSKCFVYPSLYEGFGLPILEAMSKGTIVITSNVSSMPEVGEDAAFYLNNVHNENELGNLIEKVLNLDEKSKEIIRKKGYDQIEKFTWEKCAEKTMDILN